MLLYDFRHVCQHHYTQRSLSLSFQVPQLLSPRLYSPMFLGPKKKTQFCEILIPKIHQVMFLTFSSYSINNLPNFLDLAHFPISRNLFLVIWYSDSKTTEYSVLLVLITKSNVFLDLQYQVLFFVPAC